MTISVLVVGASGMVGRAALLEALDDPDVERVIALGRSAVTDEHPKLSQLVRDDLTDLPVLGDLPADDELSALAGCDVCLFTLGKSVAGLTEEQYRAVNYDIPVAVGRRLAEANPDLAFLYVSGAGTDSTEKGRVMWARVKGETENALFALPFSAYAIRPGFIAARRGVRSKTKLYDRVYRAIRWVVPVLRRLAPQKIIDSDELGRAMLTIGKTKPEQRIWETPDLKALVRSAMPSGR
jgi:uncharacterized protein YbjT (DUF2867 family)